MSRCLVVALSGKNLTLPFGVMKISTFLWLHLFLVGWNWACFSEASQIYSNIIFKYTWTIEVSAFFTLRTLKNWHLPWTKSNMHLTRLLKQPSCSGLSLCPPISFSTSIYLPPIEITVTAHEVYQVYQTKTAAPTSKWTQMEGIHLHTTPLLPDSSNNKFGRMLAPHCLARQAGTPHHWTGSEPLSCMCKGLQLS